MTALSQIFYSLFTGRQAKQPATEVQPLQQPLQEQEASLGCEFLDDFLTLEDEPEDEAK